MTTTQTFQTEIANNQKYLTTVYRNSEYTLRRGNFGWEVTTRRLGYGGSSHPGGFKRFDSLAALVAGCKAFGGADAVIATYYGIEL